MTSWDADSVGTGAGARPSPGAPSRGCAPTSGNRLLTSARRQRLAQEIPVLNNAPNASPRNTSLRQAAAPGCVSGTVQPPPAHAALPRCWQQERDGRRLRPQPRRWFSAQALAVPARRRGGGSRKPKGFADPGWTLARPRSRSPAQEESGGGRTRAGAPKLAPKPGSVAGGPQPPQHVWG